MSVINKDDILIINDKAYVYDSKDNALVEIPFKSDGVVVTPQLGTGDDPK